MALIPVERPQLQNTASLPSNATRSPLADALLTTAGTSNGLCSNIPHRERRTRPVPPETYRSSLSHVSMLVTFWSLAKKAFLWPMRLSREWPAHPKNFRLEERMVTTLPFGGVPKRAKRTLGHCLSWNGATTDVYRSHSRSSACCSVSAEDVSELASANRFS